MLTCIRHHTTLDGAGGSSPRSASATSRAPPQMAELFADLPEALDGAVELSQRLDFTLADLGYRFPDYPLPPGETPSSYLRQITWNGARARFRPLTAKAQAQIEKELAMIEKLDLAGYFLIVWRHRALLPREPDPRRRAAARRPTAPCATRCRSRRSIR